MLCLLPSKKGSASKLLELVNLEKLAMLASRKLFILKRKDA